MDITHNLKIKASAQQVYEAVSTVKGINGWWSKDAKVGTQVGTGSLLRFNKQGTIVEMGFKTKNLAPYKTVIWECTENANPAWIGTMVETHITEEGDGCTVVFSHSNFDEMWAGKGSI